MRSWRSRTFYTRSRPTTFTGMCGRYMLTTPVDALRQLFLFAERPNLARATTSPRPRTCRSSAAPAPATARELLMVRWGLVPYWADDAKIGNRLINARAETLERTPAFREAFQRRRCLVPADGFFEWRKDGKARQPLLVRRKDQAPFAFAGLWERWRQPGGAVLRSCTIITCPANELVAPIHDRMPVISTPATSSAGSTPEAGGRELLRPCPAD